MEIFNSLFNWAIKKRYPQIEYFMNNPIEVQNALFTRLINTAKDTEWGIKYDYKSIKTINDFKQRVPISTYEDFSPLIERTMHGEQNLIWPSTIRLFSKSSGTTNAKSKFIPVSKEALEDCHYKGGKDLYSIYVNRNPETKIFSGKALGLGGSMIQNPNMKNSYIGDVSALIMSNLPIWAEYARTPSLETALMDKWDLKIEKIAQSTSNENVTSISGVPTWTIVLLERILEIKGKSNLLEIWPNFELFTHGAVAFGPYRNTFKKLFPSDKVNYLETYNASEGFFGIQDSSTLDQFLLMLDYGIFYEFLPMDQIHEESPQTVNLEDVEIGKNYAIIMSSNAGLWRYSIGDTIKFTSKTPFRFKISGRTKQFINAFGEEVIVENAEFAIVEASKVTNAIVSNYSAAPIYLEIGSQGAHEWVIEFEKFPDDLSKFIEVLDNSIKLVNSDYEAKRTLDIALVAPKVTAVAKGFFYEWMENRGKVGGQNKVPRLSNTREYMDSIVELLKSKNLYT